jgi:hypothetical protein
MGLGTEELVDWFIEKIYSLHGLPDTIVSDQGVQCVSLLREHALNG